MSETKSQTTTIQESQIDLDSLLNPGSETVMLPNEQAKKPNMFGKGDVDLSFLNSSSSEETEETDEFQPEGDNPQSSNTQDPLTSVLDSDAQGDLSKPKGGGRPSQIVSIGKKLIDKGIILPFEGEDDITKYTENDWLELFELNHSAKSEKTLQEVADKFFDSLPPQLQYAYDYVANGGSDLTSLFEHLASANQIRELDITNHAGQVHAIRTYLQATNYGTAQEIQDEILAYEDRGELEKKAKQFKPKLDLMKEQIIKQKVEEQQTKAKLRQDQSKIYAQSVYDVLAKSDLNGIKLTPQVQNMLFTGLTQPSYPASNGKQTSLLGYLLEQHQYIKPNHALIAEATWLMKDPEGYRKAVRAAAIKDANETVIRGLKTEQGSGSNASTSVSIGGGSDKTSASSVRGIQRNNAKGGFFKRPS